MIPNVFISSTISDLHYLRDGLREAIEELAYNPVMSDYAEIGYINPNSAAESCYRSIKDCQLVILIIGKRYGEPKGDGISVTHREVLTAIKEGLPLITFVEPQIINYKEVHDAEPSSGTWDTFRTMDHPRKTFKLLDDVAGAPAYNGIIPITSVADAKKKLKLQIANFVGSRLAAEAPPMKRDMQEILAQVTAIRTQLGESGGGTEKANKHLIAMRFLLEEKNSGYRKILEALFGDLDPAIEQVLQSTTFEQLITASGHTLVPVPDEGGQKLVFGFEGEENPRKHPRNGSYGGDGGYGIFEDSTIRMTDAFIRKMSMAHRTLHTKIEIAK